MSEEDRKRWDAKYQTGSTHRELAPDPFVVRALEHFESVDGLRALDFASGVGRNALELARRGFDCEAWDVSPVGLDVLGENAERQQLEVRTRVVDADELSVESAAFDLVCVVNFLHRPLLQRVRELLVPGGHLVFATFTVDRPGDRPSARHCLERGELTRGFEGFETLLHIEEGGRAGILARRI